MTLKERLIETKMPVGCSDFTEIIEKQKYFFDKSLLIKDLIDEDSKVILFTRPRRFGKTLNMTMLKSFFEKPLDGKDTSHYFKHLKIWQEGEKYTSEQGKRPVIYITFKDVKHSSFQGAFDAITQAIGAEFRRHTELKRSRKLEKQEKDFFNAISMEKAPAKDWQNSVAALSKMLERHHGVKPMVLMDEYDVPIQGGFDYGYYPQIIEFMRNFMSSIFKDNTSLYMGVITGVSRVSKESLFSGLNNLNVSTIFDEKFSEHFGFTEDEVKAMLEYYGVPEKYAEVKHWYDGYIFGHTEMYNPWSLINYMFHECLPRDYWAGTSSNAMLWELVQRMNSKDKTALYSLMQGGKINAYVNMNIVYPDIFKDPSTAYGLLAQTGYVKATDAVFSDGMYSTQLLIPNKEIMSVYAKEAIKHIENDEARFAADRIPPALITGNVDSMQRELNEFLQASCSYLDMTEEKDYQNLMVGLLSTMRTVYEIKSNREAGLGRADILLRPRPDFVRKMPGIIIEIKHYKAEQAEKDNPEKLQAKLEEQAKDALRQIDVKNYTAEFTSVGVERIIKYGASFSGKSAVVLQPEGQQKPAPDPYSEWG